MNTPNTTLTSLRRNTTRRRGHFAKQPVHIVPTMHPLQVARAANKEFQLLVALYQPEQDALEAEHQRTGEACERMLVHTSGAHQWWVHLRAGYRMRALLPLSTAHGHDAYIFVTSTVHYYPAAVLATATQPCPQGPFARLGLFLHSAKLPNTIPNSLAWYNTLNAVEYTAL